MEANRKPSVKFLLKAYAIAFVVAIILFGFLLYLTPVSNMSQEIYQVRGQLQFTQIDTLATGEKTTKSFTTIFLRNGAGQDFKLTLFLPLPGDTFFVKPGKDQEGNLMLIPVKSIVEEQKEERAQEPSDKEV